MDPTLKQTPAIDHADCCVPQRLCSLRFNVSTTPRQIVRPVRGWKRLSEVFGTLLNGVQSVALVRETVTPVQSAVGGML